MGIYYVGCGLIILVDVDSGFTAFDKIMMYRYEKLRASLFRNYVGVINSLKVRNRKVFYLIYFFDENNLKSFGDK